MDAKTFNVFKIAVHFNNLFPQRRTVSDQVNTTLICCGCNI